MDIKNENIAIYGAGLYGRRVFDCLKIKRIKVSFFIVTKKVNNPDYIEGIRIYELSDLSNELLSKYTILVAVDEAYHGGIRKTLEEFAGIDILKRTSFLSKQDIDVLFRETHPFFCDGFLTLVEPVSRLFGNDRGTPVDRYYIEKYLEQSSCELPNPLSVIEVGEDTYSKKYFPNANHDILDFSKGMDLTVKESLPYSKYEVFICTQVFHQIFDIKSAISGSRYLLKKGGVMLATVCGNITKLARNEEYDHYWGFTEKSIGLLMAEEYGDNNIRVESYGNAAVATAFIQGVSMEEIDADILEKKDKDFAVCISITAKNV